MISVGDYVLWKARWQRVSAVTDSDFRTERGERIEFNQRIHNEFQRQRMSPLPIQILSLILAGSAAVVAALSLIAALFGLWLQWTQKP